MASGTTEAAQVIHEADRTVAFTGAGVSTESGLPDFRSDSGIWSKYEPDAFHIRSFQADPASFWATWIELFDEVFAAEAIGPNRAHEALANLADAGYVEAVITQNVDRLHQAAGHPDDDVIELHGSHDISVCQSCKQRHDAFETRQRVRDGELPPRCSECEGLLKPGGVLFGEQLPKYALFKAHALAEKCDVFLVIGSSLTVEPAATLPKTAVDNGASLFIVNHDPTYLDDRATGVFRDDASTVLGELDDAIAGR